MRRARGDYRAEHKEPVVESRVAGDVVVEPIEAVHSPVDEIVGAIRTGWATKEELRREKDFEY